MYNIVIGGWKNRKSVIRNGRRGRVLVRRNHRRGPLNCRKPRRFYISWARGYIRVGKKGSRRPFLSYRMRKRRFVVKRVLVAGKRGRSRKLKWRFNFPCIKPSTVRPPPTGPSVQPSTPEIATEPPPPPPTTPEAISPTTEEPTTPEAISPTTEEPTTPEEVTEPLPPPPTTPEEITEPPPPPPTTPEAISPTTEEPTTPEEVTEPPPPPPTTPEEITEPPPPPPTTPEAISPTTEEPTTPEEVTEPPPPPPTTPEEVTEPPPPPPTTPEEVTEPLPPPPTTPEAVSPTTEEPTTPEEVTEPPPPPPTTPEEVTEPPPPPPTTPEEVTEPPPPPPTTPEAVSPTTEEPTTPEEVTEPPPPPPTTPEEVTEPPPPPPTTPEAVSPTTEEPTTPEEVTEPPPTTPEEDTEPPPTTPEEATTEPQLPSEKPWTTPEVVTEFLPTIPERTEPTPTSEEPTTPEEVTVPPATTPFPDTCTVNMAVKAGYSYKEVPRPEGVTMEGVSRITFTVKGCKDAHLVISKGKKKTLNTGRDMYEIVIGGLGNSQSVIRDRKQGSRKHLLATFTHKEKPLSCDEDRSFYLSWAGGVIQVGRLDSQAPFVSYNTGKADIPVRHVFVSGDNVKLQWSIRFPCTKPPKESCTKELALCSMLNNRCDMEVSECMDQLCHQKVTRCVYLSKTVFRCRKPLKTSEVQELTEECQKGCDKNEVMRLWPEKGEMPSCTDKDGQPDSEDGRFTWKFVCMCDHEKGYYYENGKCIFRSECGCVMTNGDYRPLNDEWSAEDCSKDYKCEKVENEPKVTETKRNCDKKSLCVKEDGKPKCVCPDKKGVPDMPGGCTGVPEKNQTCYLKGTDKELCICNKGYAPTCDGCQDINECAMEDNLCTKRGQRCVNTMGSYRCDCQKGFKKNRNDICVDVNECLTTRNPCEKAGKKSYCVNFIGTYGCDCCAGFEMDKKGTCRRNRKRIPRIPLGAPCCQCPKSWKECLLGGAKPSLGCYRNAKGYYSQYDNFRYMYEDQCLRKERIDKNRWTPEPCPTDKPTLPPLGSPQPTTPAPGYTTEEAVSPTTQQECSKETACERFPTPTSLQGSEVCGPADKEKEQTYSSYCDMLIAMCNQAGGPDKFNPPSNPTAKKGPCPTTPPTTTTPATTTTPPAPLEFTPWSKWSACTVEDEEKGCGQGFKTRTRSAKANQPRPALPTELRETSACFVDCATTPTTTPSPTEGGPTPPSCKDIGDCGEGTASQVVCGQIGTDRPDTFPSQCHLDALACNRRLPSHKLYNGQCDPGDKTARRYCGDSVVNLQRQHVKPDRPDCKAMVPIGDCQNRLCRDGNVNSCCQPVSTVMIRIIYICDNGDVQEGMLESATKCACKPKNP
ncbi:hypothetical protein ACOMHN_018532 [Nucella lapillus]